MALVPVLAHELTGCHYLQIGTTLQTQLAKLPTMAGWVTHHHQCHHHHSPGACDHHQCHHHHFAAGGGLHVHPGNVIQRARKALMHQHECMHSPSPSLQPSRSRWHCWQDNSKTKQLKASAGEQYVRQTLHSAVPHLQPKGPFTPASHTPKLEQKQY